MKNKMHTLLDLMLSETNIELTTEGSEIAWSEIAHRTIKPKKEEIKYIISSMGMDESIVIYCQEIDAVIYNVLPEHIVTTESVDIASEFAHLEFESDLRNNGFSQEVYNYKIEKTSNSPENWRLTIYDYLGDVEADYNYDIQQDLRNDVRLAAKYYQIELNKID